MNAAGGPARSVESTLALARTVAAAMVLGVLAAGGVAGWIRLEASAGFLAVPAGVLGIVSPVLGYRLFLLFRERVPPEADAVGRRGRFLQSTLTALAVTEGAALFGVLAFALTGQLTCLIGVVTHMILTGALWPTEEKLDGFLSPEFDGPAGG